MCQDQLLEEMISPIPPLPNYHQKGYLKAVDVRYHNEGSNLNTIFVVSTG
jgi:hypothetical protein